MKKLFALILAGLLSFSLLCSCGNKEDKPDETTPSTSVTEPTDSVKVEPLSSMKLTIGCIKDVSAMSLSVLRQRDEAEKTFHDYSFSVANLPEVVISEFEEGKTDIAFVPVSTAVRLYNEKGNIKLLALNVGNVMNFAETEKKLKNISDLKGKTVYASGKGTETEYLLRHVLEINGLKPDTDVTLNFVESNDKLLELLLNKTANTVFMPEPQLAFAQEKVPSLRTVFDVKELWKKDGKSGGIYSRCIIAKADFAEKYAPAITRFLEEYGVSYRALTSDPERVASLCRRYGLAEKEKTVIKALDNSSFELVTGSSCKAALADYLNLLFTKAPSLLGGKLPDANFCFAG